MKHEFVSILELNLNVVKKKVHFKHFGLIYFHINQTLYLLHAVMMFLLFPLSSFQHWVHCASFRLVHGWSRRAESWALVLSALPEGSRGSAGGSWTAFWATPSQQSQQGCLHCQKYYWLCLWLMSRITTFELLLVSTVFTASSFCRNLKVLRDGSTIVRWFGCSFASYCRILYLTHDVYLNISQVLIGLILTLLAQRHLASFLLLKPLSRRITWESRAERRLENQS